MQKIMYVGVSPKPYFGCNYWYVDDSAETKQKTFVWVKMGRHDTEQMVFVDSVYLFDIDKVPYPYERTKKVLRQATKKECEQARKEWNESQIYL